MLQYEKIDVSEAIDVNKTSASKECMLIITSFTLLLTFEHIGILYVLRDIHNRHFSAFKWS